MGSIGTNPYLMSYDWWEEVAKKLDYKTKEFKWVKHSTGAVGAKAIVRMLPRTDRWDILEIQVSPNSGLKDYNIASSLASAAHSAGKFSITLRRTPKNAELRQHLGNFRDYGSGDYVYWF